MRRVFYRILFFYVSNDSSFYLFCSHYSQIFGIIMVGMLVAYNNPALVQSTFFYIILRFSVLRKFLEHIDTGTAAQSPFVIAMNHAGIKGVILSPVT